MRTTSLSLALVAACLATPLTFVSPAQAAPTSVQQLADALPARAESTATYDRALFEHWVDEDGDGCDTRREVLIEESQPAATVGPDCSVSGTWLSWYDAQTWTDASRVDIDHLVALSEAWDSGADRWTREQRRAFANDLGLAESLVVATDTVNAAKSDLDPAQWLPPAASAHCDYAVAWVLVKYRWNLTVDTAEDAALTGLLNADGCGTRQVEPPAKAGTSAPSDPTTPSPAPDRSTLTVGATLQAGEQLTSSDGRYRLVLQGDGNLVLYTGTRPVWASTTTGAAWLVLQGDGNLVLYRADGRPVWHTRTTGAATQRITLQDDGNLVLYAGTTPAWYSGVDTGRVLDPRRGSRLTAGMQLSPGQSIVSPDGRHRLAMQTDGNVVVYTGTRASWSSRTSTRDTKLLMQADGNLVAYAPTGTAVWSTRTSRNPGAFTTVQTDGNTVVYASTGRAVWNSRAHAAPPRPPAPPAPQVRDTLPSGAVLTAGQALTTSTGHRLVMQGDGNAVLYTSAGAVAWASGTAGAGARLVMQGDGNLVVYLGDGSPAWSSGTSGNPGARAVLQTDANFVVYRTTGTAAWHIRMRPPAPPQAPRPPAPQPPAPPAPGGPDPRFSTCRDAKSAGYGPYSRGIDVEYDWYRDADGDGLVCE